MDYIEKTTSNYFFVRDENQFKSQIKDLGIEEFFEQNNQGAFCVCSNSSMMVETGDDDYFEEDNFADFIRDNLRPDQKCFISQIGYEGLRYFTAGLWRIMPYRVKYYDLFYEKARQFNNNKDIF